MRTTNINRGVLIYFVMLFHSAAFNKGSMLTVGCKELFTAGSDNGSSTHEIDYGQYGSPGFWRRDSALSMTQFLKT